MERRTMIWKRGLVGAVWVCALLCMSEVFGQSFMSASEKAAMEDVSNGHFITARNKIEAILKKAPESIGANYVMALVFWEGEGNLLRAMVLLKKALGAFEQKYCGEDGRAADADDQVWHQRMSRELARVYAELDDRNAEIGERERISKIYGMALGEDAVWGLMKLDRFEEAAAIARGTIEENSDEGLWIDSAYNDLTAIADARHLHMESYRESLKSVQFHAGRSCVVLMNHARSLSILLKMPQAVEYYQKAQKSPGRDCVSNPLMGLSGVYILDLLWQKAISAMLKARKAHVEPRMRVQTEAEIRAMTSDLFYVMGFAHKAYQLMETVVDAPRRLGYDSLLKEQLELANALIFYAQSVDYLKRLDERIFAWRAYDVSHYLDIFAWLDVLGWFGSAARERVSGLISQRGRVARKLWTTRQKIFKHALNEKNLRSLLVPTYVLSPQYHFALADALGLKTASYLADYQESLLGADEIREMRLIFDHLRAYIAWREHDDPRSLVQIAKFREHLKPGLSLMAVQMDAIEADIMKRGGKTGAYYEKIAEVYAKYPTVLRHLDIPLPVRFDETAATSSESAKMREMVLGSLRFEAADAAPFVISWREGEGLPQICLSSQMGRRYACSSLDRKDYEGSQDVLLPDIVDNFFHHAFAPKVDLSQADLHSLDGTPVQATADQALENLLRVSDSVLGIKNEADEK